MFQSRKMPRGISALEYVIRTTRNLSGVLLLFTLGISARAADPNDPGFQALRNLFGVSAELALPLVDKSDNFAALASIYRVASNVGSGSERAQVYSAEKALHNQLLSKQLSPKCLLTLAYLKANSASEGTFGEALKRHGSAFEVCLIPANQAPNLHNFAWRIRGTTGSPIVCRFPFMWAKHPELYHGSRPSLDIFGNRQIIPERQFSPYLQGALDWFNRSRPLEAIDPMLAQTGDEDVLLNGLLLLERHANRSELLDRWERLVTYTNLDVLCHAIDGLGEFKSERAVAALAKAVDKKDVGFRTARALGETRQAGAVKHLARLADHEQFIIRLEVVIALAKIPTIEARDLLGKLARDKNPTVSGEAKQVLAASPK